MRINIFTLLLITIGFILPGCNSSQKIAETPVKVESKKFESTNSLLWKISGNGLTKPSYVFGTIHMIPAEDYFMPEKLVDLLKNVDEVVFEIDLAEMSDMSSLFSIINKVFMNDGLTLKDLMSEEDYDLVNEHFSEMGLPMMFLNKIKPMFLQALAEGSFSGDGPEIKSYELELFELANQNDKPSGGLETMDFQISIFDSIPYQVQADMLVSSLKNSSESDDMQQLIDLYKNMEIEKMVSTFEDDEYELSKYENILLTTRNKNWIPSMADKMAGISVLYAVGAGHLGGKNGVLALLFDKGYDLTPILTLNDLKPVQKI
jgi:uncharacterized protein YbaP (TraB family)